MVGRIYPIIGGIGLLYLAANGWYLFKTRIKRDVKKKVKKVKSKVKRTVKRGA